MKFANLAAALIALGIMGLPAIARAQGDISTKRVTLNMENADLRYALKLLFSSAGVNYVLDQAATGVVTVSLSDVPFRTALESILKSTSTQNPLTYRVEDGIYYISLKKEEIIFDPPDDTQRPPAKQVRVVKIPLNFADVHTLAQAFGWGVIDSGYGGAMNGGGFGNGFGNGSFGGNSGGFGGFGGQSGYGGFGNMGGIGGGFGNFGGFGNGSGGIRR